MKVETGTKHQNLTKTKMNFSNTYYKKRDCLYF